MNQELQSTNEELDTANAALLERGREVIQANDLLESILGSLDQSVVVVDKSRRILSWNAQASEMWGLRSDEVTGQAAFSLDIGFPLQKLRRPMGSILSGRAEALTVETDAINRRGRTFACKVTIRPLRGREAKPDGAVIFMEDVG